eukprot:CAMPEP_0184857954 /NCGR_PEP_ID=MMETSP0580-20130426/3097_1 /TAXON_ID=1118495 /ORGANISM="Dactyliosolen fragilissimus" /LENGTH=356 /DNA_ID=CAMNT_0027353847 /DNA_START=397 /DNA_END=1468 /DNA_ORIENTATION=-
MSPSKYSISLAPTFPPSSNAPKVFSSVDPNMRPTIVDGEFSLPLPANLDLPPDYSRPWTKEKYIAIAGAFFIGSIFYEIGSLAEMSLWGEDELAIIFGGVGIAIGWYGAGGGAVMQAEKESTNRTGGYDAKLIADRPARLQTILDDFSEIEGIGMRKSEDRDISKALEYVDLVHGSEYVNLLKKKCSETNIPTRLNPLYARTLIDKNSYNAAIDAVQDWLDGVDAAMDESSRPLFALSRPPGHHACRSKGMGGCLLNNAAIAAFYALNQSGVERVAILDIDAHHGNGIAHCIQDEPKICYCSIHEGKHGSNKPFVEQKVTEDDPRSQESNDTGPIGNLCNINLKAGTGWESGYSNV